MSFIDDFERHELYLARLATQLLNAHIYPSLTEAYKAARMILLDAEQINSPAQLNKITAAIRKATNDTIAKSWEDATAELEQIAIYEAGYYAALVGGYQDARLKTPADKQIAGYVARALMSLTSGDRVQSGVWSDYVGAQIASVGNAYDSSVKAGFANGETVSQIAGRLRTTTDGLLTREAEALARTGVQHYANRAREAMAEANADVIEFRVYWATMDNRTTTLCAGRHLKKWKMDDNKFPDIPAHYNCLSEDTLVTTCSRVSNIYKRAYKGVMVNITTKSGRSIKITPNHPILTSRGWVKAGEINLLDKVLTIKDVSRFVGENYKYSAESKFGELFSSVDILVDSSCVTVRPTTAKDFHGDISNSDVKIINADSFGWDRICKMLGKKVKNNRLPFRSFVDSAFNCFGSFFALRWFSNSSFCRKIGSFCHGGYLLRGAISHSRKLLLRPIPKSSIDAFKKSNNGAIGAFKPYVLSNPISSNSGFVGVDNGELIGIGKNNNSWIFKLKSAFFNDRVNKAFRDAENLPYFIRDNPLFAEPDDVISCFLFDYDGHVYNLENEENWYLSNGIITHNCRSSWVFTVYGQDGKVDGTRAAIGGNKSEDAAEAFDRRQDRTDKKIKYRGKKDKSIFNPGQIAANTKYDDWLRKQPAWFQDSALGATRAKLFREGGMSIGKFNDMAGRPLTLAQLRELDAEAFKRAGL